MGLWKTRRVAAMATAPSVSAAAGVSQIGAFPSYSVGYAVERALTIPTVARARDLIAGVIGSLDLRQYSMQWTGENYEQLAIPGESWFSRPDPNVTRQFIMGSTFSDLFFYGRSFWYVTSRYSAGFPASFTWLPAASITTPDQVGPVWYGASREVLFNGSPLPINDVVQFISPISAVLSNGGRAIDIAIRLDEAAKRFAVTGVTGYLQQTGGEPMSGDELAELAASWQQARQENAQGALNEYVRFVEFNSDPSKLQLTEGRQHSALELARVANIPPWLVGVSVGGMTYQNAQEARRELYLFAVKPFADTIAETLSGPNVTARGRHIRFDVESWLGQLGDITINETSEATNV